MEPTPTTAPVAAPVAPPLTEVRERPSGLSRFVFFGGGGRGVLGAIAVGVLRIAVQSIALQSRPSKQALLKQNRMFRVFLVRVSAAV